MSLLDPNVTENPCYRHYEEYDMGRLEFSCLYGLDWFYTDYEKNYWPEAVHIFMKNNPALPIGSVIAYMVLIYLGQEYFKTRERWNWRFALGVWNLFLTVFSLMGVLRTLPHLLHNLYYYSFRDNFCYDPRQFYGVGSTGLWCQLFVFSKFFELFDTFFIVVHKKPLLFLHWYHHVTVLLYTWYGYLTASTPSLFFVSMNFLVHSFMYFYYFLMAARMKPKWFNPIILTAMQIAQMILGIFFSLMAFYYFMTEDKCWTTAGNMTAAALMYGSYLFLFGQFFVQRYFGGGAKMQKKKIW